MPPQHPLKPVKTNTKPSRNKRTHKQSKKSFTTLQRKKLLQLKSIRMPHNTLQSTHSLQPLLSNTSSSFLPKSLLSPLTNPTRSFFSKFKEKATEYLTVKTRSETETVGTCVGIDDDGNKYYEYRETWMLATTPPRRRVEYSAKSKKTFEVHELWDTWLRHGRSVPPSNDELQRYAMKRQQYLDNVRRVEYEDMKLRSQEQLQMKVKGILSKNGSNENGIINDKNDPNVGLPNKNSAQASIQDILQKLELQLAEQRAKLDQTSNMNNNNINANNNNDQQQNQNQQQSNQHQSNQQEVQETNNDNDSTATPTSTQSSQTNTSTPTPTNATTDDNQSTTSKNNV